MPGRPPDRRPPSAPSMTQTEPMPEYARLRELGDPPEAPDPWESIGDASRRT